MTKDTFSRTKPSVNFSAPPPINVTSMQFVVDGTDSAAVYFNFTSMATTGMKFLIYATAPVSKGVMSPKKSQFKFIATAIATDPETTIDSLDGYPPVFGYPAVGEKVFAKLVIVITATGQKFDVITLSALAESV